MIPRDAIQIDINELPKEVQLQLYPIPNNYSLYYSIQSWDNMKCITLFDKTLITCKKVRYE